MNVLLLQLSHSSTPSLEQDIFAINQDDSGGTFSAMAELDKGKTLARVIELSRSTLVVLDKERAAPFARLWYADVVSACCLSQLIFHLLHRCLYEIGSTPPSKLRLLTNGFNDKGATCLLVLLRRCLVHG